MNEKLYQELVKLRDSLTEESGRGQQVCSDKSLKEMERLMPRSAEDFLCITGLGKVFAEKYADDFLAVLAPYFSIGIKSNVLTPSVKDTLKNLENRLININKRNRLLLMQKLSPSFAFDLASSGVSAKEKLYNVRLVDFVKDFDSGKRFEICNTMENDSESEDKKYQSVSKLMRELARTIRETGENDLYIAYPFIEGKVGDDFNVRAPLALFPVEVIRDSTSVCVKMDNSKDVMFNNSLILTFNKFNNITTALPNNIPEEINKKFIEQTLEFYESNGIKIVPDRRGVLPFESYSAETFPKHKIGEFVLTENVVLGKFSMYSSALQKDFRDIMEGNEINDLLNNLLQRYEDVDFYSDSDEANVGEQNGINSERNLNYINDLNISQESAIQSINANDKLVIQGPPGTGKSQTITSLISDFVNKGKNVLMVSQKKAALDVIYSRLGKLNKYALMVHDVKDKDGFYEQLSQVFNSTENTAYNDGDFNYVSDTIDADLVKLTDIANKMYYDEGYGEPIYKIYLEDKDSKLDHQNVELIKTFSENTPTALFDMGFNEIKNARRVFRNKDVVTFSKKYYDLLEEFPYLPLITPLSQMDTAEAIKDADAVVDLYCKIKSMPPIKRLLNRGKLKRAVKNYIAEYFITTRKKLVNLFAKEPIKMYNCISAYSEFDRVGAAFNQLDDNAKLYFGCSYNVAKETGSLEDALSTLKDFVSYYYINDFESRNKDIVTTVNNYNLIVKEISQLMLKKKDITKARLKYTLQTTAKNNIITSKRSGDIQRVIEGKRKWNVSRFVSKFKFELMAGVKIWLLTPEVVSEILPLENGLFDLLIFDEASQIYIEKGVPSIARAKKVVIAGDHKQLRPSSLGFGRIGNDEDSDDLNAALEEESLLDLARFKYPEILLNYHYRSKYSELISFSNYAFYKGRLNVSPNVTNLETPPIQVHHLDDGVWVDRTNLAEANEVVRLIREFFISRENNETIGVITFNSQQRDLILDLLEKEGKNDFAFLTSYNSELLRTDNGEDVGLFVKNIENVQGDERDNIIFSLAYAKNSDGKLARNFGWLNQAGGENRLNVAISRAKQKIDIVTSIFPEELKVNDLIGEGPRIFKKYLEYAYAVSNGNQKLANDILQSFSLSPTTKTMDDSLTFASNVAIKLMDNDINVSMNIGLGSYRIDIGVMDNNGKYLLGIECDKTLYEASAESRERDIHRKKYLEGRGWKLYRLFSSNWWKDEKEEIQKIKKAAGL